jgi:alcohol dehydrogenase (cytochrome c)
VFGGGTNDRFFRAFDAKTGNVLWEQRLNSGVIGVPVSFEADGKQYIAVQSGWGIDAAGMQTRLSQLLPDYKADVPLGGVIWVFEVK